MRVVSFVQVQHSSGVFFCRVRSILSDDIDKYALNLCKASVFYVVQLCDDIRIVSLQVCGKQECPSSPRSS